MEELLQFDKRLFLALNFDGGPFWDQFFWAVSGKLTWLPLYVLVLYLLYRRYGWKETLVIAVLIVMAVVITDQVCNFFKNNIPKLRPTHNPEFEGLIKLVNNYRGHPYGTVSAHAATSFGIMTISSYFVRRSWFTVMMALWALLICYSRIYIGAHYPLDIFFGTVTGIITGVLLIRLYIFIKNKIQVKSRTGIQE